MVKKILCAIVATVLIFSCLDMPSSFAATQASAYLCDIGVACYELGKYEEALSEFNKVLLIEPENKTAQEYINRIFQDENQALISSQFAAEGSPRQPRQTATSYGPDSSSDREQAIEDSFDRIAGDPPAPLKSQPKVTADEKEKKANYKVGPIDITGEIQLRGGVTPKDAIWKLANWDLNEKNWRVLSVNAYNERENTFDRRIYDRLRVNLDSDNTEGFGMHSIMVVDPWSFTGKTDKVTIPGLGGDAAEIQLKYWSNTRYTLNENVWTLMNGDSFNLPEIKVYDNNTTIPITVTSAFGNTFSIPKLKIHREFQPVRQLAFDYKADAFKVEVFPFAYENKAVTFDDPLKLSNNRIWWENSPWVNGWTHGMYNPGPGDFTQGFWDMNTAFFARDSEGQRLSSLRGMTLNFNPGEKTSFVSSVAAPRNPWQDIAEVDNIIFANRAKHFLLDNLRIGAIYTSRFGFNIDRDYQTDARNYVAGTDINYEFIDGLMASAEFASSKSYNDISNAQYKTESTGNSYYVSLMGRFPRESIINTEHGYDGIKADKEERFFNKFRVFATRMDAGFQQPLSDYTETRDDEFWGRHLHFRRPFKYYYQGEGAMLTWDDIKNFAIGNGIDYGRSVFGLRVESSLWDNKIENLLDVRNVHNSQNNKFIENVVHDELTWQVTDKLTAKALGIYQKMPKTKGGFDPFVFNPQNGVYDTNAYIKDGEDTSLKTGSFGMEYDFFDWLGLNGTWEYTNDVSLGYDEFPRGVFNGANRSLLTQSYGNTYRDNLAFLYNQDYFPAPPYPYYNIFKSGLRLSPMKNMDLYLDYTRNSYAKAGQINDNMNHVGFELAYTPISKISIFLRYTYSRWQDLDRLAAGYTNMIGHHNFFTEFIYRISQDQDFTLQYGEASRDPYMGGVLDIGWDPYGGSLSTIDTRHIVRAYYSKRF
jgi:tetratricopeptide (TPR) repeat protein